MNPGELRFYARSAGAFSLCVLISLLAVGCGQKRVQRASRVAVTLARVEVRDMPFALSASGTVEALNPARDALRDPGDLHLPRRAAAPPSRPEADRGAPVTGGGAREHPAAAS